MMKRIFLLIGLLILTFTPAMSETDAGGIDSTYISDTSPGFLFSDTELHSPMMNENKPKTESGGNAFFNLINEYPKTAILIGCLLVIIACYIYRKVKAIKLESKSALMLIGLLCASSMSAQSSSLYKNDINVVINDLGNARICESRQVGVYQGTEGYIKMYNLQGREVGELAVSDEQGDEYECLRSWNVDASFDEKANKCGIYKSSDGPELCWGIGSYGIHTYHVRYTLTRLVKAYDDYDGFLFIFYQGGVPYAKDIHLTIKGLDKYFNPEDVRVWAFGHHGNIFVKDGAVEVQTTQPFRSDSEKMTVMVQFKKGIFHPATTVNNTFYKAVKKRAFKNSKYQDTEAMEKQASRSSFVDDSTWQVFDDFGWLLVIILAPLVLIGAPLVTNSRCKRDKQLHRLFGNVKGKVDNWFRDVPCRGNLQKVAGIYFSITNDNDFDALRKAHIMRLLQNGKLSIVTQDLKKRFLVKEPEKDDGKKTQDYSYYLQKLLYDAAGENHVIDPNELKQYVRQDPVKLRPIARALKNSLKMNTYHPLEKISEKNANEVMGLKHFLEDFTLASERTAGEVALWKDFLVYATLFDIAEQVSRDMKSIIPELNQVGNLENIDTITREIDIDVLTMASALNTIFTDSLDYVNNYKTPAEIEAERASSRSSSGWGGSSSYGGGGGAGGGGGSGFR